MWQSSKAQIIVFHIPFITVPIWGPVIKQMSQWDSPRHGPAQNHSLYQSLLRRVGNKARFHFIAL